LNFVFKNNPITKLKTDKIYQIKSKNIKIPPQISKSQIKLMQTFSDFSKNMKKFKNGKWV